MAIGEQTKFGKILAEWQVPEYIKHERSKTWLIGASILGIVLLIHALYTLNFLFGIIIILVASIVFLHERFNPDMVDFMILETGIVLGEKFMPYRELTSFWIIYEPPHTKILYFGTNQLFRKELPIHLEQQNPIKIRQILLDYLQEDLDKEAESTEEALAKIIRL